jgi:hypothetical protein
MNSPEALVPLWNTAAAERGLPRITCLSSARMRVARTALAEEPDLKIWAEAFKRVCAWDFRGDGGGWKPNFDYALRPSKRDKWLDEAREAIAVRQQVDETRCKCGGVQVAGTGLCYSCLMQKKGIA